MKDKLRNVYLAASRMFIENGFKTTQVGDIAKAAGVATGTMYKLFDSKTACLHFCLLTAFSGGEISEPEMPMGELREGELMAALLEWAERYARVYQGISERMSFSEMLPKIYDEMVKYRTAICLMESCCDVLGEAGIEYWKLRRMLFEQTELELQNYMNRGEMRHFPYLRHLVPSFFSMMSTWALHAHYERGSEPIDEEVARAIAMDLMLHAYYVGGTSGV